MRPSSFKEKDFFLIHFTMKIFLKSNLIKNRHRLVTRGENRGKRKKKFGEGEKK